MAEHDTAATTIEQVADPTRDDAPVILFDGVCNLCNGVVQFVIRRDPRARFRFASLQSAAARDLLTRHGVADDLPDSVVLVANGRVRTKSAAALGVAGGLGLPWSLLGVFWLVPAFLRDAVYDWIARNRYRWFGRREECMVPTPALRERFLDTHER